MSIPGSMKSGIPSPLKLRSRGDRQPDRASATALPAKMTARGVKVFYGAKQALKGIDLDIQENRVLALIGPSGCGKSTFLRCLNRMNDTIEGCRVEGRIALDGEDVYGKAVDAVQLRARVGMVFQKPNPFPTSIYDNVAYGPRIHGLASGRDELDEVVQTSLKRAGLWGEVKDRLREPGTSLSGGKGGVWGTLLGVAILALIQNALNLLNVSPYFTQLVQGLVIFTAVAIDMNRRRRQR